MYSRLLDQSVCRELLCKAKGSGRREKNASTLFFSRVANRCTVGWPQISKSRLVALQSRDHSVEHSNQRGFSI